MIKIMKQPTGMKSLVLLLMISEVGLVAAEPSLENHIEEVEVISEQLAIDTEMNEQTERLFSVAGAANDPLQALYAMPGVTFSSGNGPGGSEPVIRGSAPQDNAYYIDMMPASYLFHVFGNSIFDKHLIRSFDLYPAAFSSEYGNATGGVIDVKLREPRHQDFTTTLHTSILSAGVLIESGIGEDHAFYVSYRRSMMDQFIDEDDVGGEASGFSVNQLPISDDYQVNYNWSIDDQHNLSFIAAGASDLLGATFSEGNNEVAKDPDFAGPAEIDERFGSQGVVWEHSTEERSVRTLLTHISDQENFFYGADFYENTETNRYLGKVIVEQSLAGDHRLKIGISYEDIAYDLDFRAKFTRCSDISEDCSTVDVEPKELDENISITAYEAFVEDQWFLNDQNSFTLGLYFSNDDYLNEGRPEPRARWDYFINNSFTTYLAAGQYSQLPRLKEMLDKVGNPGLTTIKSDHFVWGIGQEFGDGWRWNTDLYYKNMQDVVIGSADVAEDIEIPNYINGAEGSAYGVEFLLNKDLTDKWYGWASLSLSTTDRTNNYTGEAVSFEYDKPVLFNVVLNRMIGEKWMLGIKWSYQSGARYTPIVDLSESANFPDVYEPVYGELNSERYPDYHRLDVRADYTSPKDWGYWKFYIDILNVYNRENIEGYDYQPNGEDLVATPDGFAEGIPVSADKGDGLFPSIGFEIQF